MSRGQQIHDFALYANRSATRNAALFLYGELAVSAHAHSYTVEELGTAMQEAGFEDVVIQPFLPDLTFLLSGRKPLTGRCTIENQHYKALIDQK